MIWATPPLWRLRRPPSVTWATPLTSFIALNMCFRHGRQRCDPSHDTPPSYLPPVPWLLAQATPASALDPRLTCSSQ